MSKAAKVVASIAVNYLTERQGRAEHKRLAAEIAHNDELYHEKDAPEISDADYDKLRRRLKAIEERFPRLVDLSSPTQRVAPTPTTAFAKVRHLKPMLSLSVPSWPEAECPLCKKGVAIDAPGSRFVKG